jgi:ABC-type uncharacterized transport system ATPase subunit
VSIDHDQLRDLRRLGVQSITFAGGEMVAVSFFEMSPEERGLDAQAQALDQQAQWLAALDDSEAREIARKAQEELVYGAST